MLILTNSEFRKVFVAWVEAGWVSLGHGKVTGSGEVGESEVGDAVPVVGDFVVRTGVEHTAQ